MPMRDMELNPVKMPGRNLLSGRVTKYRMWELDIEEAKVMKAADELNVLLDSWATGKTEQLLGSLVITDERMQGQPAVR
ncbi:hypothetical protein WJX73_005599 [Symbiochloris irregularis]|uniref:Uncharacterized protein n=1 Tax=Symbiochloris irregularis TaxID=706552 RepID=A0AAW1P1Q5_9CHLO